MGQAVNQAVRDQLRGLNIYLVGMMGAGKTTVGQQLAAQLGYGFVDSDAVLEQSVGRSISQIFAESGEAEFRGLETQVLAQLASFIGVTIATGGGIVLRPENWSYLQQGLVVWLDVTPEQICDRLKDDTSRPLLQTADPATTLRDLLEQRIPLYAQADLHISVQPDETPQQICDRILALIPRKLKTPPPIPEPIEGNLNEWN